MFHFLTENSKAKMAMKIQETLEKNTWKKIFYLTFN